MFRSLITVCLLALFVSACGSDSDSPVTVIPPEDSKVTFTAFVDQAVNQDADAQPLEVDDSQLIFDADDNPDAFDYLIIDGS